VRTPVSVGVVGLAHSGPRLARAFDELPDADVRWLCDHSLEAQQRMKGRYPHARITSDLDDLLGDESLDAVVLATPAVTHYDLARRALEAEKHLFVEEPLALRSDHAAALVRLAEQRILRLLVGHVTLFDPAVRKLKELIELGRLGDLYYLYGCRKDLGELRTDSNVLWTLGSQHVSMLLYLVGDEPIEVTAHGEPYIQPGIPDVAFCFFKFATGISAHLHLSWLDPQQVDTLTVIGSRQMAVLDELDSERKVTIYQKSAVPRGTEAVGAPVQVRLGGIVSPRVAGEDPLGLECAHFVAAVRSSAVPGSAKQATGVVEVLEALQRSLDDHGTRAVVGEESRPESRVIPLPVRVPQTKGGASP
jgi:predicted dehydrogenase